ncbi:hypothetical protein L873DRAFT_1927973 [Choiromyces venosus 120613-1]|uniref:Uncharacterized protein n=1 Tax=Choiromyces venosus 120613-1 TaxID=1336337 RepID=A0A3N4K1Z9_9PEZI|nr:hypothetical protein L873DRAFT_1927973 [Choiromyces venosus 120613-1]
MSVPVHPGYIMDLLVRTSQVGSICQVLVKSDEWLEVNESSMPELAMLSECGEHYSYICLYSEDTYCLLIDTEKVRVPHLINFNPTLVESEFHLNPTDRRVKPNLITDKNVKFVWGEPITFPVFIPSIPEFLDSCLNCIGGMELDG